jgi:hypothetical protein
MTRLEGGTVKIFASEEDTSVAMLIALVRRIARKRLTVVSSLHPQASLHPRALSFRSTVLTEPEPRRRPDLLAAIHELFLHQLALHRAGALPPPVLPW